MSAGRSRAHDFIDTLASLLTKTEASNASGSALALDDAFRSVAGLAHAANDAGSKLIFIGNGGSAGIASHLAVDFCKNGGLRALAFNDASALTCLGNDLGYEHVFAKQLDFHARPGDVLMAISSSGASPNILAAVTTARTRSCAVVTFSGFADDNALRRTGDVNFYVRSRTYGFVEIAHLALCHAILDLDMGWEPGREAVQPPKVLADV